MLEPLLLVMGDFERIQQVSGGCQGGAPEKFSPAPAPLLNQFPASALTLAGTSPLVEASHPNARIPSTVFQKRRESPWNLTE
jgi:hypothetical protein